jgi:hypothetical protein
MMSNFSDARRFRLLAAIARECELMSAQIAELGELVTSGDFGQDPIIAFQSFDYLTQQANAHGALIGLLARGGVSDDALAATIDAIPLPAMRHRLHTALDHAAAKELQDNSEAVFWLDS